MDISPNLPPTTSLNAAPTTMLDRTAAKKVTPIDAGTKSMARPAESPFVAPVVTARLSETDFQQSPSEIAPPDRTLRPYGVPMLPFTAQADDLDGTAVQGTATNLLAAKNAP